MNNKEAIARLTEHGIKPSVQRIAIMHYLLTHFTIQRWMMFIADFAPRYPR